MNKPENPTLVYCRKKIGENITKYRKAKNLTQKELAKAAGIAPQSLSCIETGINSPSFNLIIKIAQSLNIPLAYIFTFDDTIYNIDDRELLFLISEAFKGLDFEQRKIAFKLISCFKNELQSF